MCHTNCPNCLVRYVHIFGRTASQFSMGYNCRYRLHGGHRSGARGCNGKFVIELDTEVDEIGVLFILVVLFCLGVRGWEEGPKGPGLDGTTKRREEKLIR